MTDDATPVPGPVTIEAYGDARIVSLRGAHDISTAEFVRDFFAEARRAGGPVLVDLAAATFIDSTIVSTLYNAYRADTPSKLRLIMAPDTQPHRVFLATGLDVAVPVV